MAWLFWNWEDWYLGATSVPPISSLTSRKLHDKLGVEVYAEDEHKNMKVISCLKTFSFTDLPLASYSIVYCILAMVTWLREINILHFSDFPNLHIKADSFSTGFVLLKLRSKDRIKRNHFCMSASLNNSTQFYRFCWRHYFFYLCLPRKVTGMTDYLILYRKKPEVDNLTFILRTSYMKN